MDITQIQDQIRDYSSKIETTFLSLADRFPQLMTKDESTAMNTLLEMLEQLSVKNDASTKQQSDILLNVSEKYDPLFKSLNSKIEELSTVNEQVKQIKNYSEEMELIALNAMVISIKSGEKGRAFSSITDNLKQLSTDMNIFSNKLLEEEEELLVHIKQLQSVFDSIMVSQKELSSKGSSSTNDVQSLISNAAAPLSQIRETIDSVYPPIQNAMEGLQVQDIIRQALDHVMLCLKECSVVEPDAAANDTNLDTVTFNIDLYKLAKSVLEDIDGNLEKGMSIFQSNWQNVTDILGRVEPMRSSYVRRFLDKDVMSPENIVSNMDKISGSFKEILSLFASYQANQKDLEKNCNNITDKAHSMFSVFESLKPIVDRLHHVRILQQIEVAKNPAISAVRDSVIDMDNLINAANVALDKIQDLLTNFIKQIKDLLDEFTAQIENDNEKMISLRQVKNVFFGEFKATQENLTSILSGFTVLPDGFEQQCTMVQSEIDTLQAVLDAFKEICEMLGTETVTLEKQKSEMLSALGYESWELKDDRFKDLIKKFTITAHKSTAGTIGNFEVEQGAEAGEITFF